MSTIPQLLISQGVCSRGKSCPYQHDSEKVAICPKFLTGECTQLAGDCLLSHEPTLNRVAPCIHFQKNGRCKNGDQCIYPHVRFGVKQSVCRDFAVLGYCDKGIDCEMEHVRECPDFAESGTCKNPKCKLPHVIRSNRRHGVPQVAQIALQQPVADQADQQKPASSDKSEHKVVTNPLQVPNNGVEYTFEGGDEFIPLTFVESEDEEEPDEDEEDEDEESDQEEDSLAVFG